MFIMYRILNQQNHEPVDIIGARPPRLARRAAPVAPVAPTAPAARARRIFESICVPDTTFLGHMVNIEYRTYTHKTYIKYNVLPVSLIYSL